MDSVRKRSFFIADILNHADIDPPEAPKNYQTPEGSEKCRTPKSVARPYARTSGDAPEARTSFADICGGHEDKCCNFEPRRSDHHNNWHTGENIIYDIGGKPRLPHPSLHPEHLETSYKLGINVNNFPQPTLVTSPLTLMTSETPILTSFLPRRHQDSRLQDVIATSHHVTPPYFERCGTSPTIMTSPTYISHTPSLMTSYRLLGEVNVSHPTYGENYVTYNPEPVHTAEAKPWIWGSYLHHRAPNKRKGGQVRFTNQQTIHLESKFERQKYLSPEERRAMAKVLNLSGKQVKTWFQNRRAKWRRLKQEAPSPDQTLIDDSRQMTSPTSTSDVTDTNKVKVKS